MTQHINKPPTLYKYVRLERALADLRNREIRMTQPRFLNDPHELSVEINALSLKQDFHRHLLSQGCAPGEADDIATRNILGMVIEKVADVKAAREQIGVMSLSETIDNMLLWAHYADEHRGAVLEIDVSQLLSPRVEEGVVEHLTPVTYSDERIDFIDKGIPYWMTLGYKSEVWKYEREWRFFKSLQVLRRKSDDVFVLDLPPNAIRGVVFGARGTSQFEEETLALLQSNPEYHHVVIRKATFSSGLVGLNLVCSEEFAWRILHGEHHFGDNWREFRQWVDMDALAKAKGDGD